MNNVKESREAISEFLEVIQAMRNGLFFSGLIILIVFQDVYGIGTILAGIIMYYFGKHFDNKRS